MRPCLAIAPGANAHKLCGSVAARHSTTSIVSWGMLEIAG